MLVYQTKNRAVAITLATCGVPFVKDRLSGRDLAFVHIYDAAILRQIKDGQGEPRYKGWPAEKAAIDAFRRGIPGLMVYSFQRTPLCERVLKAYDRHSKAIAAADAGGLPAPLTLNIEPEDAAVLCAQFTKNRNIFNHGWKAVRPYLHLPGASDTRTESGKTVIVGSFRLVPLAV